VLLYSYRIDLIPRRPSIIDAIFMPRIAEERGEKMATSNRVRQGAVSAKALERPFAPIRLPVRPPYPPMEARSVDKIPAGDGWLYEPKWDGFRCLAFRQGKNVQLQSKAGQPLHRYFPELVKALGELPHTQFVLDGEIVIYEGKQLSFDNLLMRIHPAESRVRKLSEETPATYICFDLLVTENGEKIVGETLSKRWEHLKKFFRQISADRSIRLSPASTGFDEARKWMNELRKIGLDGVVAKRLDEPYRSGEREGMVKIKRIRTADTVVGGFRYAEKGGGIGSLLLGLYDKQGLLDHVGFTSSFNREQRQELKKIVEAEIGGEGFTGKAPGGPSRWSTERSSEWVRLKPELVVEVEYDHFSGGRFRHGTKFLRWRPEKKPSSCTFEQLS
jgi:ATP-dependent DNA ligase